jgi:hypothetical protein
VKEKTKILVKLELHATKETANNGGGGWSKSVLGHGTDALACL